MSQISSFKIEGLYNARTINLQIEDNTLILVGENGTGKSTVVNILYFFLTSQWNRIDKIQLKSISATINNKEYYLSKNNIKTISETDYSFNNSLFSPRLKASIESIVEEVSASGLNLSEKELTEKEKQLARNYGIPHRLVRGALRGFYGYPNELKEVVKSLQIANIEVAKQVLYLPTYRRIEQDLEKVLPGIDIDELKKRARSPLGFGTKRNYIELVEFGMEDVVRTIRRKTDEIQKKVRSDLSNLTGEYLRDVIRGSYRSPDLSQFRDTDQKTFEGILNRIPEDILQDNDKIKLRQIVKEFDETGEVDSDNQVVAHFLTSLIQLYQKQQEDEKDIRDFVSVCNEGYLTGKQFRYDSENFDVKIFEDFDGSKNKPLPMSALSSGEKQIVSLFSHLYLSGSPSPFVIIDEPELSLSVPWQKRFLPDISEKSNGFIAVTHSPFIYDNSLRKYTHSLEEFIEPFKHDPALPALIENGYDDK